MNFWSCQILTVLSLAFFCQTNASNVFMQCSEGKDQGNSCNQLPKDCKGVDENTKLKCAVTCGLCPKPQHWKHTPVVLKKINGPNKERNGQTQVAIWSVEWKKGLVDSVYFYPSKEGRLFEGFIEGDPQTKIEALGDVTDGKAEIAFYFKTDKTVVATAEVNADSSKIPLNSNTLVKMGDGIASGDSGQSRNLEARLFERQANPVGYKAVIQPVYDQSVRDSLGANAAKDVKSAALMAAKAFMHKSNPIPFELDINEPMFYPKKVTASAQGFVDIITGQDFDFASLPKNITLVIFFTKTAPQQITDPFNLEYGGYAQACNPSILTRTGIMEMFGPPLTIIETLIRLIGRLLGFPYDFDTKNGVVGKNSSTGASCYKVGGFMDITAGSSKWSECSKEGIEDTRNKKKLDCLIPLTCTGTDMSTLCPAIVTKFGCDKDYVKTTCLRSCGPDYCSASVLKNATTLPDKGCLPTSCMMTTPGAKATASVLAAGDTTMAAAGKTATCKPCGQMQFNFNGTGDCLLACPQIKRNIGCDQADIKSCCKSTCYIPTQAPNGYNPNANNNGNVADMLGSQYCARFTQYCSLKKYKDVWCVATCRRVNGGG